MRAEKLTEELRFGVGKERGGRKGGHWSFEERGVYSLSKEEYSGVGSGCGSAFPGASWTSSCKKRELSKRREAARWKAVRVGGRKKLVVSGKTSSAGWRKDVTEVGDKKRTDRGAGRERK